MSEAYRPVQEGDTIEGGMTFLPMQMSDLHEVFFIEQSVFSYHWTYRNFLSALAADNLGCILRDDAGKLLGYFVAMAVVDEFHLLKIAVARPFHGKGLGRLLMDKAVDLAHQLSLDSMLLEVRKSNVPAIALYENTGFKTVGIRKGYYTDNQEDALVMRYEINPCAYK